jgi:hypothetical protein
MFMLKVHPDSQNYFLKRPWVDFPGESPKRKGPKRKNAKALAFKSHHSPFI